MDTTFARVLHKRDSVTNWETNNPILLNGEIAFVVVSSILVKIKIGDGATPFANLPYCGDLSGLFHIYTAVPATNPGSPQGNIIYETSTPGSYTHFLDSTNTPIVVNSGEYVRIIDEGTYYTKVVVPVATSGLVSTTDFQAALDAIFDADYTAKPTRPSIHPMFNKHTRTNFGFYAGSAPVAGDWYIDMEQQFRLSRLSAVLIRNTGAPAPPSILTDCQIVTISDDQEITFLGFGDINVGAVGGATPVDLTAQATAALAAFGDLRCYIAARDTTANEGLNFDTTGGAVGRETWGYRSLGGGAFAIRAQYHNTDVNYEVQLYDETGLQREIGTKDFGVQTLYKSDSSTANVAIYTGEDLSVVLCDTTGWVVNAIVYLPRFGVSKGKTITVKYIAGTNGVDVTPLTGALIDQSATPQTLASVGNSKTYVYDGEGVWWSI